MKLSQNIKYNQQNGATDTQSFRNRLQRQSEGLGMLVGSIGFSQSAGSGEMKPDVNHSHGISSSDSLNRFVYKLLYTPIQTGSDLAQKVSGLVRASWARLRSKQRARKEIIELLSLSDHSLDDIGLDRPGLMGLLHTHGNLEKLRNEIQRAKSSGNNRLRLIDCSNETANTNKGSGPGIEQAA